MGHNPVRQAFLSGPRGLRDFVKLLYWLWIYAAEMSKMIDLCLSGVFFQALKYAKTRFLLGLRPRPHLGAYDAPPDP